MLTYTDAPFGVKLVLLPPLILFGVSFFLWLCWNAGCLIEMAILGVRIWNSFVPLCGLFVYIAAELLVQIYRFMSLRTTKI